MTVRYSREVGTSTFFSSFRLLFKWKGSIWKSVLMELALWSVVYFLLKIAYTYWMTGTQREVFEDICTFCNNYSNFLPITFMLGFYVQAVFGRWQKIFNNIGWIDTPALALAAHVKGTTEYARNLRRNIIRYLILTQALVFRDISTPVKKRLPTIKHLIPAGFVSEEELLTYDSLVTPNTKYYLPIQWALALLGEAKDSGLVTSDMAMVDVAQKIYQWREQVVTLTFFDWVQVPLAYTQVVHLAVSTFFIAALMGRQFLHPTRSIPGHVQPVDPIVPFMSMLQFIFLVGWTKVAEIMLNPMGEDDDDFETNWLLDRNLQVGLALADSHYGAHPPLKKDKFWAKPIAEPLYTPESASLHRNPQIGSCADISMDENSNIMIRLHGRRQSHPLSAAPAPYKNPQEFVLPFHLRTPSLKISDSSLPAVLDTLPENSTTVQSLSDRSVDDGGQSSQEEEEQNDRNSR